MALEVRYEQGEEQRALAALPWFFAPSIAVMAVVVAMLEGYSLGSSEALLAIQFLLWGELAAATFLAIYVVGLSKSASGAVSRALAAFAYSGASAVLGYIGILVFGPAFC